MTDAPLRTRRMTLRVWVRTGLSCALLAILIHKLGARDIAHQLERLSLGFTSLACLYYGLSQVLSCWRWQLLLAASGARAPFHRLFGVYMIGMFLNNLMPGAIGGDVVRAYWTSAHSRRRQDAYIAVFLERLLGLAGLCLLGLIVLACNPRIWAHPLLYGSALATGAVVLGVLFLIWWPPATTALQRLLGRTRPPVLGRRLQDIVTAVSAYRQHRQTVVMGLALSMVIQGMYAGFYALISVQFGHPIALADLAVCLPAVTLASTLPISFGGLGVREGLFILLLGELHYPAVEVFSVSLTAYLLAALLSLSGGLLLMATPGTPRISVEVDGD